MRRRRFDAALPRLLAGGLFLPALAAGANPDLATRVRGLEAQLRTLSARVEALEQRAAGGGADTDTDADRGGIVWTLGDVVSGTPLRITHKELAPRDGRLDLLLEITAPLAEPARWLGPGAEPPLVVTLRDAAGGTSTYRFRLVRGISAEPGARLHLSAAVDPARATAARQVIIDREADDNGQ